MWRGLRNKKELSHNEFTIAAKDDTTIDFSLLYTFFLRLARVLVYLSQYFLPLLTRNDHNASTSHVTPGVSGLSPITGEQGDPAS